MPIVLRRAKGSQLTIRELDNNFVDLDTRIKGLEDLEGSTDYNDLTNKPDLFSGSYNDLTDKPVLFSGNYEDLTNKPTLVSDLAGLQDVLGGAQPGQILQFDGVNWYPEDNIEVSVVTNSPLGNGEIEFDNSNYQLIFTPPDLSSFLQSYTETDTLDSVISRGNTTTTTAVIPFLYDDQSEFPDAGQYHGAIAHSHLDGAMYFAHSGVWNRLANSSELSNFITGIDNLSEIGNVSSTNPTTGQVLKWNGSEWAPSTDQVSSTSATLEDFSVTTQTPGIASLSYDNTTGVFTYTPPDLSAFLTAIPTEYLTETEGDARYLQNETVTSLGLSANTLSYVDETGTTTNFDLSLYLDDTNLARLTNGSLDAATGIATFTRDDGTTFTVDFSALIDVSLSDLSVTTTIAGSPALLYDDVTGVFTYTPPDLSVYLQNTAVIGDLADVSSAAPSSGQVLKWNGSQWAPATDQVSSTTATLEDFSVTTTTAGSPSLFYDNTTGVFTYTPPTLNNITATGDTDFGANRILYSNVYSLLTDLEAVSANTYHGMFAHVHATGKGYFAHAGAWIPLANESDVPTSLLDLNITDGTSGQVLSTNGAGTFSFVDPTGGIALTDLSVSVATAGTANLVYNNSTGVFTYTPPDLSTYLTSVAMNDLTDVNTSGAVSGSVLKYNGTSWVIGSDTDSGIALTDLSVSVAAAGTANLAYNNTTGVFTYTPPDLSTYLTSVAFADLTSTPTTLSGYGITDALSQNALGDFSFVSTTIDTAASAAITVVPDVTFAGAVEFSTLQSTGAGVLTLDSASSVSITASDQISITAGTGSIILDNQSWPQADGTAGQYLSTNGAGQLSWATVTTGDPDQNLFATIAADTGTTTADTTTDTLTVSGGTDITTSISGDVLTVNFSGSTGISSVQADTTPQLGGDLDIDVHTVLYTFDLGATASTSNYTFNDPGNNWFPSAETDPILYLRRGETYQFINVSGSHPLAIRVSAGGSNYNVGVVNNGGSGTVTFTVPMSAPATLYYQCAVHSAMGNTINVV